MHNYFSRSEKLLWLFSITLITVSFLAFDRSNYLTLAASLVGVSSLLLNAKGNPAGQALSILFSLMYGVISLRFAYYGEMITYLGMTAPMAVLALVAWLRHPYEGNRAQVQINHLGRTEFVRMAALAGLVTFAFYFILAALHTANLLPGTVSVTTSFAAVYLTWRRSPWFAVGYALNDLVLIVLWALAAAQDPGAISVLMCFVAFFANDLYGFRNWRRMLCQQQTA